MKYIYVPVQFKGVLFVRKMTSDHRRIIDEYARQGYRYAGCIPTHLNAYGGIVECDLVFEKDDE